VKIGNGDFRSATRSSRCSQTGRGRSANRLFGNRVSSEDGPDQVLTRAVLSVRISLPDKSFVCVVQTLARCRIGRETFLREHDQRPADRQMSLFRDAPNLSCEWPGDRDALPPAWSDEASFRLPESPVSARRGRDLLERRFETASGPNRDMPTYSSSWVSRQRSV
jgi:hypothetical protein